MNRLLFAYFLFACVLCMVTSSCNNEGKNKEDTETFVILMGGQSNMVGKGDRGYLADSISMSKNIRFLDYDKDMKLKKEGTTFGPEYGLAQVLSREFPTTNFIFIKYASDGATLYNWDPEFSKINSSDVEDDSLGDMYTHFLSVINKDIPSDATPLAFLWLQGEDDKTIHNAGKEYKENLDHIIRSFRRDLKNNNLPFIIGLTRVECGKQVCMAQKDLAFELPQVYLVETCDLSVHSDQVHYNDKGLMDLGRRFGTQIVRIIKKQRHKIISF